MFWPMLHLTLAFCGVAVVAVFAVRVGIEVRRFSAAVGDSSERIARAAADLERAAVPLSRHGGALSSGSTTGPEARDSRG